MLISLLLFPQAFFVLVSLSVLCSAEKKWNQYLTYKRNEVCLCAWYLMPRFCEVNVFNNKLLLFEDILSSALIGHCVWTESS